MGPGNSDKRGLGSGGHSKKSQVGRAVRERAKH